MILNDNIQNVYSNGNEIQKVYSLGKLVWEKKEVEPIDYSVIPFTIKAVEDVSVGFRNSYSDYTNYVKYSINGGDWVDPVWHGSEFHYINLKRNDTISVISSNDIHDITFNGLADVYGNILSLKNFDRFLNGDIDGFLTDNISFEGDIRNAQNLILPRIVGVGAFSNMFRGCSSLLTAPELPATTLAKNCYHGMFRGCSSLTVAPELPASILAEACYAYMFDGCKKLDYIKCHAIQTNNNWSSDVYDWLDDITTTGKLLCKQVDGGKNPLEDYIPDSWTVEYF